MMITKRLLSMLAFAAISLSACSDDSTTTTPVETANFEIVASPMIITAKLQSKVLKQDFTGWTLMPWQKGAGKIVATLGVNKDIVEANVSEDGSFTITLPGTLKYPFVIQYVDLGGGLTANPNHFLTTGFSSLFSFYPPDNPATTDINESEVNQELVSPKIVNEADLTVLQEFGYIMTESATLTGTSTNGKVKYNSTFKKGWNIETWKGVDGVTEYSVVNSLPANVVWF